MKPDPHTDANGESADSAQRQSPNQEIANDANNRERTKTDSGNGTTARTDTNPKGQD